MSLYEIMDYVQFNKHQHQFLKNRDTHIAYQPDTFVYLRDNEENENPMWKEFEVTLKDGNGNVKLGPDGKPMIAIAPPASNLCGRVFLSKPNERGEVKRARVVELIKDFEGKVSKDKDLIKFKLKYDHSDLEDVMSYNEILDYVEREYNNEDGHHWKFRTILGHIHTPVGHKDRMGSDYNVRTLRISRSILLCAPRNMISLTKKDGNVLEELLTEISIFNDW
jgi:hypothetical protein